MTREELIAQCKYYNGEDKDPFKGIDSAKSSLFFYESKWVEFNEEGETELLEKYIERYDYAGLTDLDADNVPKSLKALLFSRWCHWAGGYDEKIHAKSFRPFYKEYYG